MWINQILKIDLEPKARPMMNKKYVIGYLLVLFGTILSISADAESYRDNEIDKRFAAADVNHDGKLTLKEAEVGMPRVAEHFDQIDTDHKGYVTLSQIKAVAGK